MPLKRTTTFAVLVLACLNWACQGKIGRAGESVTVQGCVASSAGKYTLTDDSGRAYELSGKTSDLANHVGEQAVVRGEQVSSSQEPEAPPKATSHGVPDRLVVTSVTFTSQKCSSGR